MTMSAKLRNHISAARKYQRWLGRPGLLYAVRADLLHQTGEFQIWPSGYRAPVALRLGTSDAMTYGEIITRGVYALRPRQPPRVIVDAGANIGLASVYFAKQFPGARILALEPERSNYALLCKNAAAYPQIAPIQAALWSSTATLDLVDAMGQHAGFRTQTPGVAADRPVIGQVAALDMPRLLADYQVEQIDILKVDIECSEIEVFAGAAAWIGRVGVILIELHDRFKRGCALSFYTAVQDFEVEWRREMMVGVARQGRVEE
jgi:FkbM family methyltransferase